MSDSEIESDSSEWSYQGTTEEEEDTDSGDIFSIDEVVEASGVGLGNYFIISRNIKILISFMKLQILL